VHGGSHTTSIAALRVAPDARSSLRYSPGHYECFDQNEVSTEKGLFGFRARSLGKPFTRFP
jgi:hypothetical protein